MRSGVIRYLEGDIASAKQLVKFVSLYGAKEAWKVVGITTRLFAMLVLHMKLWFSITEDCIKKGLNQS